MQFVLHDWQNSNCIHSQIRLINFEAYENLLIIKVKIIVLIE
jgi:hypothetical protein